MGKMAVALACAQCFVFSFLASSYFTCVPYNTSQCTPFRLFILLVRVWMTEDMLAAIVSTRAKLCCTVSSKCPLPNSHAYSQYTPVYHGLGLLVVIHGSQSGFS